MKIFIKVFIVFVLLGLIVYPFFIKKWFEPSKPYVIDLSYFKGEIYSNKDYISGVTYDFFKKDFEDIFDWGKKSVLLYFLPKESDQNQIGFMMKVYRPHGEWENILDRAIREISVKDMGFVKSNIFHEEKAYKAELSNKKITIYSRIVKQYSFFLVCAFVALVLGIIFFAITDNFLEKNKSKEEDVK